LFAIVVALVTLVGILEWTRLPRGPLDSLGYDGFRYLAGACSLLEQGRYLDVNGESQRTFPPGTSLLYAVLGRVTGARPEKLVTVTGLICYLTIVVAMAATMRTAVRRWPLAALGVAAVGLNTYIISLTNKLWSEPPAMAVLLWALFATIAAIDKRSEGWMLAAILLFSVAIGFRFALIATVPLAFLAAGIASRRLRVPALALLSPLPMMALLRILAPGARAGSSFRVSTPPFGDDWKGLTTLANQIVPTQFGWVGVVAFVALIGAVVSIAGLRGRERSRREITLFVHVGWVVVYAVFLLVAQSVWIRPPVEIDLRMLIPLFPSIVIVLMTGADRLMDTRPRALAVLAIVAVAVGTARAVHPLLQHPPQRTVAVDLDVAGSIYRLGSGIHGEVASNAPGLAWFVLRRPIRKLSDAPAGSWIIFVDARQAGPDLVETDEILSNTVSVARDGCVLLARR
jgi:hypothetical protein